jgi:putative restriction endonuclease
MTPLAIALIEKTGWNNGFEYVAESLGSRVTLGSARHRARATITSIANRFSVVFTSSTPTLVAELGRLFDLGDDGEFRAATEADLASLLARAAMLAKALPSQAADQYSATLAAALAKLPPGVKGTEIERLVIQRVGQHAFRQAQMDYWGGACAVTGVSIPEVLRASHAKPWAECESDAERLDVYNGFLLSANLDALFDRFLISFTDSGQLLCSSHLKNEAQSLGITDQMRLRWISEKHIGYLSFHRKLYGQMEKQRT